MEVPHDQSPDSSRPSTVIGSTEPESNVLPGSVPQVPSQSQAQVLPLKRVEVSIVKVNYEVPENTQLEITVSGEGTVTVIQPEKVEIS